MTKPNAHMFTFGILKEDVPSTQKDLDTKLKPGVYMGMVLDERMEVIKEIAELEDDELYAAGQDEMNAEITAEVGPGHELPPQSKEERMTYAQGLRDEFGIEGDINLYLEERNCDGKED